jgi:hypothetical protein
MAHESTRDVAALDLSEMFGILARDMRETAAALKADPSQYHRRVAVRGLFALVEAVTYMLKQQILEWIAKGNKRYTIAEIALLKDEAYTLDAQAQRLVHPKFLPTDANFRFAMNLYARDYQPEYALDVADNGWNLAFDGDGSRCPGHGRLLRLVRHHLDPVTASRPPELDLQPFSWLPPTSPGLQPVAPRLGRARCGPGP